MSKEGVSDNVISFLASTIYSIGQLETLLLLYRTPDRQWTAVDVAKELRSNRDTALQHLQSLANHSLLELANDQLYRYNPRTDELGHAVEGAALAYATHRTRIIDIIYGNKTEKINDLANAFRLRRDK
jgi:DNA-binding IclR family transcriptional regulator